MTDAFEQRVAYLFATAKHRTAGAVASVISDAAAKGALGSSRVGISIAEVVEKDAERAIDEALASYDRQLFWPWQRRTALDAIKQQIRNHLHNSVREIGRQSDAYGSEQNQVLDRSLLASESRLLTIVEQFQSGLTNHRAAVFIDRHKTMLQLIQLTISLAGILIGALAYLKASGH